MTTGRPEPIFQMGQSCKSVPIPAMSMQFCSSRAVSMAVKASP